MMRRGSRNDRRQWVRRPRVRRPPVDEHHRTRGPWAAKPPCAHADEHRSTPEVAVPPPTSPGPVLRRTARPRATGRRFRRRMVAPTACDGLKKRTDECFVQSRQPFRVMQTHEWAPRVLPPELQPRRRTGPELGRSSGLAWRLLGPGNHVTARMTAGPSWIYNRHAGHPCPRARDKTSPAVRR